MPALPAPGFPTASLIRSTAIPAASVVLAVALAAHAGEPIPFTEEAAVRGINYQTANEFIMFGRGLAFADLDGDGDADLILTGRASGVVGVYENDGTGHFTSHSAASGIPVVQQASSVLAADYDADGDPDLYLGAFNAPNLLLRNDGGFRFTNVAAAAGVDDPGPAQGCAWADYDLDGDLDLYLGNRTYGEGAPIPNRLYRNNGDGTFTDVAPSLGVDDDQPTFQAVFFDFDRDADPDLYLSTDKGTGMFGWHNRLFENNGDGTFTEITEESGADPVPRIDSMGVAAGDFDHNGFFDLYPTNIPFGNPLLLNNGDGTFTQAEEAAGVQSYATGWGAIFFDCDNDGREDLYVCNSDAPNRLYVPSAGKDRWPCLEVGPALGVADPGTSYCAAAADIDGDGDIDLAVSNATGPVRLFINHAADGGAADRNWAKFRVEGWSAGNPHAFGAVVDVRVGDAWYAREIMSGGNGYKTQNDLTLHFGLGEAAAIDEVRVMQLGGASRTVYRLPANATYTVTGCPADWFPDGALTSADFFWFLTDFFDGRGDYNADGGVDTGDFFAFLGDYFAGC